MYVAVSVWLVQRALRDRNRVGRRDVYDDDGNLGLDEQSMQRSTRLVYDIGDVQRVYGAFDLRLVRRTVSVGNIVGSERNHLRCQSLVVGRKFVPLSPRSDEA